MAGTSAMFEPTQNIQVLRRSDGDVRCELGRLGTSARIVGGVSHLSDLCADTERG